MNYIKFDLCNNATFVGMTELSGFRAASALTLRQLFMNFIEKIWYQKNLHYRLLAYALLPFSFLYYLVFSLRRALAKDPKKLGVPVIVIGNLTVGGTGKTPVVIHFVEKLKREGKNPGVISRGYKGRAKTWPQLVVPSSNPVLVGDEPVLIALKTGVPVCVGPDRVASAQKLIKEFNCDVIISDDGLAHYALAREEEIVLVDGLRQFGNGFLLPAGPLREPLSRLKTVTRVLVNGRDFTLLPEMIYQINSPRMRVEAQDLANKTVYALCAIGNPQRFFNSLATLGIKFIPKIFPDHYLFSAEEINLPGLVIMTEKDAVKCHSFVDERHYALSVVVSSLD